MLTQLKKSPSIKKMTIVHACVSARNAESCPPARAGRAARPISGGLGGFYRP